MKTPCVSQLFESCVAIDPDRIAVTAGPCKLSYGQLNEQADLVANQLRALGARPETLVGLCLPRSPALLVGALAILNTGAAYLPIDPADPAARTEATLTDAGVSILISQHPNGKSKNDKRQVIALDQMGKLVGPRLRSRPSNKVDSIDEISLKNLAYVIYTSGSTGIPKGVEITHANLSNLVSWHQNAFKITPEDRATCLARVSFDASVWEIWPYLASGASLHVPDANKLNDPDALQSWLIRNEITITFVPTPMAERLLALPWPSETKLRIMLTGGDALHIYPSPDLPFMLINNYGPTECTVVATSCPVPTLGTGNALPSIGSPIRNTKILLLDENLFPVPAGAPGEMYIGGDSVARGYRNRPDLTAKRFIPDPFDPGTGRLFRTGDRAQNLPNGQIAFLGRVDEQVKIRGFRIEPGEIVAALDQHPTIFQSAVIARETTPGQLALVAYIVSKNGSIPTLSEIREFLGGRLPDYMVPAHFVKLSAIPLTPNGKVDRTALPVPDADNTIGDGIVHTPQTEVEEIVARTLAPLLGVETVDVQANFFSLGAHSLLGVQLISRLRESIGVELSLRTIFEAPSVAELSAVIEQELCKNLEMMNDAEPQQNLNAQPA